MNGLRALIEGLALLAMLAIASAADAQPSEDAIKAAFLPKFAHYVSWPSAAAPGEGAPFVLCIIGPDPFGRLIDAAAATETIDGHAVTVRRIGGPEAGAGCHIAYLSGGERQVAQAVASLSRLNILTITDRHAGNAHGMIHFMLSGGRVRFFIDDAAAANHGLTINSRLLALAMGVKQRP